MTISTSDAQPIFALWLLGHGLDPSKEAQQPQAIKMQDNPNQKLGTGTYNVATQNGQPDTVEFSNQHNIFAQVDTEKNDKVKLDGPGWVQVSDNLDGQDPPGHDKKFFINKNTNSAVCVAGGGTVTDDQGNVIPADKAQ